MIVLEIVMAGVVGTILMITVMAFISLSGWANGDMVRALGSLVTKTYEGSLLPGLAMHFTAGAVFAVPYAILMGAFPTNIPAYLAIGAAAGLFHGAAISFILLSLVAENHPVERFRNAGFTVAIAHVAGHIFYGIGVGAIIGILGAAIVI